MISDLSITWTFALLHAAHQFKVWRSSWLQCVCVKAEPLTNLSSDMSNRQYELTCYAVRDVDGARTGEAGRQCHALKCWSAGLVGVLTLALLSLCAAVPAARL